MRTLHVTYYRLRYGAAAGLYLRVEFTHGPTRHIYVWRGRSLRRIKLGRLA